jgi:hypothetical protein
MYCSQKYEKIDEDMYRDNMQCEGNALARWMKPTNVWIFDDQAWISQMIRKQIIHTTYINDKNETKNYQDTIKNIKEVEKQIVDNFSVSEFECEQSPYKFLIAGKAQIYDCKTHLKESLYKDHYDILGDYTHTTFTIPYIFNVMPISIWDIDFKLKEDQFYDTLEVLCPYIFKFINESFDFENEHIRFVRVLKALINGELNEKRMTVFLTGVSGSAKSTFARVLASMFPSESKSHAKLWDLQDKFVRSELKGKILNISDDEPALRLNKSIVSIFETLLGGLPIPNYIKHKGQGIDWNMQSNMLITSNGLYQLPDDEIASILNRSIVFFMHKTFITEDNKKDPIFEKKMIEESECLFNLLQITEFTSELKQKPHFIDFTEYWRILSDPVHCWCKLCFKPRKYSEFAMVDGIQYREENKGDDVYMSIPLQLLAEQCGNYMIKRGWNTNDTESLKNEIRKNLVNAGYDVSVSNQKLRLHDGDYWSIESEKDIRLISLSTHSLEIYEYVFKDSKKKKTNDELISEIQKNGEIEL